MKDNQASTFQSAKNSFQDMINSIFWMFILQGVSFILMAVSVYLYPSIVTWLFIFGFCWLGLTAIVTGVRTKKFGSKVDQTMATFQ